MLKKIFKKVLGFKAIPAVLWAIFCVAAPFAFTKYSPALTMDPALIVAPESIIKIDDRLLNAIIRAESSNNPKAFNRRTGARGLTQITPVAWRDLKRHYGSKYKNLSYLSHIYNPAIAREAGKDYLHILAKYLRAKGIPLTYQNVLAAYVWGPENLHKYGLNRLPRAGKRYVSKVINLSAMED